MRKGGRERRERGEGRKEKGGKEERREGWREGERRITLITFSTNFPALGDRLY